MKKRFFKILRCTLSSDDSFLKKVFNYFDRETDKKMKRYRIFFQYLKTAIFWGDSL